MKRVALVTGGTRGIGFGVARSLAKDGFALALCGVRQEAEATGALDELRAAGGEVRYFRADVSSRDDRERLVARVRSSFGRLHVLVNNAGIAPETRADLLDTAEDSFDRLLKTNLKGPFFLTQTVARWMVEQRQESAGYAAAIVFVTSVSAEAASPDRGEYCVSKAGLSMTARLFALRLAAQGIPVFEVRPGIIRTDMTARVADKYDRRISDGLVPQRRWGEPDDVGRTVAALARGDAPYSTGSVITVDGGLMIPRL